MKIWKGVTKRISLQKADEIQQKIVFFYKKKDREPNKFFSLFIDRF